MATFDASQATYNQPIAGRLGQHGVSFPRGNVVIITDDDDTVLELSALTDEQTKGTASANNPKAGSGDFGLAIFRRGITYTITAGESTILDDAGYTVS